MYRDIYVNVTLKYIITYICTNDLFSLCVGEHEIVHLVVLEKTEKKLAHVNMSLTCIRRVTEFILAVTLIIIWLGLFTIPGDRLGAGG